ncbi:hypothetical protein [Candidatus Kuenenia sp.]|uniref:hypothetical protein n=1 Tax=Candidatus Kuenenia sp. TaxID=2499824 RepID=UPI003220642C
MIKNFLTKLVVERLFKERGIEVDKVFQRVKTHRNGDEMEVDILAINGEYIVLIEAKSTLKIEDVREHLEREDSDKYAYRNGLFVIGESGDAAVILNDTNFQPKVW